MPVPRTSRTAGTRSAGPAEADEPRGGARAAAAAERDAARRPETPTPASTSSSSWRFSLGESQTEERLSRVDQAEPEGVVAAGRAEVVCKFFERRFDRGRIGDALLHQHRGETGYVRRGHRRSGEVVVRERVEARRGELTERPQIGFDDVEIEGLLKDAAHLVESAERSAGRRKLHPWTGVGIERMIPGAVDCGDGYGAVHVRGNCGGNLGRIALLEFV